jgi:hypothetical protein
MVIWIAWVQVDPNSLLAPKILNPERDSHYRNYSLVKEFYIVATDMLLLYETKQYHNKTNEKYFYKVDLSNRVLQGWSSWRQTERLKKES